MPSVPEEQSDSLCGLYQVMNYYGSVVNIIVAQLYFSVLDCTNSCIVSIIYELVAFVIFFVSDTDLVLV